MNLLLLSLLVVQTPPPPLPPVRLSDLERFPDSAVCSRAEDFNSDVQAAVAQRIGVQNKDAFLAACRLRWRAWWELDMANCYRWCPDDCAQHLENLRRLIGEDAYERGVMPCAVPVELMQQ